MSLISNYLPAPYQGVSQVPVAARLKEACEDALNCIPSIPLGFQKRPPVRLLSNGPLKDATGATITLGPAPLWMEIPRGGIPLDVILLVNNLGGVVTPYLFKAIDGTPIAVTASALALAYLAQSNPVPNSGIRGVSIEDFTFLTNRSVTVANGTTTAPTRNPEALLWAKVGEYGRTYTVTLTQGSHTVTVSYTTPNGSSGADANYVGTNIIIGALVSGAQPSGYTANGCLVVSTPPGGIAGAGFLTNIENGSTLYLQSLSSADFTVTTDDGQGGTAFYAIKDQVQNFSDLPLVGVQGMVVEVAQSAAGGNSDYYVQYETNGSSPTGGVWNETVAPGTNLGVNPNTLPIAVTVNETTGVWTCDVVAWTGRTVGDANLVPDPAFIGDQITDIKWWRGRLALIYNGGLDLSASDSPFKFYTTTLAAALDSDPIGLLTPAERKTFFKQGFTFDQRFFVFADRVQAAVATATGVVTPSATGITTMAQAAFSDNCIIQQGNHKAYFLASRTSAAVLYRLAIDRLSGLALEDNLTQSIPELLPLTLDRAATWEADYMTLYGSSGSPNMFLHLYQEDTNYQTVQNSFTPWQLPPGFTLEGVYCKDAVFRILLGTPDGKAIYVTIDASPNVTPQAPSGAASTVPIFLDLLSPSELWSPTYSASSGNTLLTAPQVSNGAIPWFASLRAPYTNAAGDFYPEGYIPTVSNWTASTVTLEGDWHAAPLWLGLNYTAFMVPSQFFFMGQDGKPQHDGRLSLKRLKVDLGNYGSFAADVAVKGRATRTYLYEGYSQDDPETPIDAPPNTETAVLDVPLAGNARDTKITFFSNSHLGFKLLGYEWKADWNPRSRRVT